MARQARGRALSCGWWPRRRPASFPDLRVVDVNLKECRSFITAANQILFQIAGVKEPPVSGLDGVFEKLWVAVEDTKYLVLILDEIDAIFHDRRYNPSDFLYRLVRRRETRRPPLVGRLPSRTS